MDGVISFDGDALLFGAEVLYSTFKLSATQERSTEVKKCTLASIRSHLGLTSPVPGCGRTAFMVFAAMCGCDYGEGAAGMGEVHSLALLRHLLAGREDDATVIHDLEALLQRPLDASLAGVTQCTGCARCGHESGIKSKVKSHTVRTRPCQCCLTMNRTTTTSSINNTGVFAAHTCGVEQTTPTTELTVFCCQERRGAPCECAFHRTVEQRKVQRGVSRLQADPQFLANLRRVISVFDSELQAADAAVHQELRSRGMLLAGDTNKKKFTWQHRPSVVQVHAAFAALPPPLMLRWSVSTFRSKMIPALLEWDLRCGGGDGGGADNSNNNSAEFKPVRIKKVHGGGGEETKWRYLVEFERTEVDVESLGRIKKTDAKAVATEHGFGATLTPPSSRKEDSSTHLSQQRANNNDAQLISVQQFDREWLDSSTSLPHRAVRMSLMHQKWPSIEAAWMEKQQPRTGKKKNSSSTTFTAAAASTPIKTDGDFQRRVAAATPQSVRKPPQSRGGPKQSSVAVPGPVERFLVTGPQRRQQSDPLQQLNHVIEKDGGGRTAAHRSMHRGLQQQQQEQHQQRPRREIAIDDDDDTGADEIIPSPLKRQRTPSRPSAAAIVLPSPHRRMNECQERSPYQVLSPLPPMMMPESENLKMLRRLVETSSARKAAQKVATPAAREQQQEAGGGNGGGGGPSFVRLRQRGREVGRLLSGGTNAVEVIDLVSDSESSPPPPPSAAAQRLSVQTATACASGSGAGRQHRQITTNTTKNGGSLEIDLTGDDV